MNVDRNNLTAESPFIVASAIIILSHGKTFIENKPSRLNLYMKTLLFLNIVYTNTKENQLDLPFKKEFITACPLQVLRLK